MTGTPPRTLVLTIPRCADKYELTRANLAEHGLPCEPFYGVDRDVFRLLPMDTFDVDRVGDKIGHCHVAACISHYLMWKVMSYLDGDAFWALEYDAMMEPDWRTRYERAMAGLPDDWDIVFLGSCCTQGRPTRQVGENLFEVKYPLCGHGIMIRKKALPVLLDTHQKVWGPLDIAMFYTSLPKLRVYTILPAIIGQRDTAFPP